MPFIKLVPGAALLLLPSPKNLTSHEVRHGVTLKLASMIKIDFRIPVKRNSTTNTFKKPLLRSKTHGVVLIEPH